MIDVPLPHERYDGADLKEKKKVVCVRSEIKRAKVNKERLANWNELCAHQQLNVPQSTRLTVTRHLVGTGCSFQTLIINHFSRVSQRKREDI